MIDSPDKILRTPKATRQVAYHLGVQPTITGLSSLSPCADSIRPFDTWQVSLRHLIHVILRDEKRLGDTGIMYCVVSGELLDTHAVIHVPKCARVALTLTTRAMEV